MPELYGKAKRIKPDIPPEHIRLKRWAEEDSKPRRK